MSDNNITSEYRLDLYPTILDKSGLANEIQAVKLFLSNLNSFETSVVEFANKHNEIVRVYNELCVKLPPILQSYQSNKLSYNGNSNNSDLKKTLIESIKDITSVKSEVSSLESIISSHLSNKQSISLAFDSLNIQFQKLHSPQGIIFFYSDTGKETIPNPQSGWSIIDEISSYRLHDPKTHVYFDVQSPKDHSNMCARFKTIDKTFSQVPSLQISLSSDQIFKNLKKITVEY